MVSKEHQVVEVPSTGFVMAKRYLIEGKVEFCPRQQQFRIVGGDNVIKLFSPVSDCFSFLLAMRGEVLSYDRLINLVWGEKGRYVSPNTLYQNISLLRKALVSAGLDGKMIKTIPKKGLMIDDGVVIEEMNEDTSFRNDHNEHQTVVESNRKGIGERIALWASEHAGHIVLLILLLIILSALGYFLVPKHRDDFFDGYQLVEKYKGCRFYSQHQLNERQMKIFESAMADEKAFCQDNEDFYFTISAVKKEWSVLECSHDKVYCEVYYSVDRK